MKFWRRFHPNIAEDDPRYHQVSLLYSVLMIMLVYFGVLSILNVTLFDGAAIAAFDFTGFVLAAGIFVFVSRGGNFHIARWLVVFTLIFVLLGFIQLTEGRNYSFIWVTLIPPLVFFLHGIKVGTWVTAAVFAYCAWLLNGFLNTGVTANLTLGALFNFVEVSIAQLFIFRHYERSRRAAYRQLQKTSVTDPLTGLYNRLYLDEKLNEAFTATPHRKGDLNTAVLLIDIDHFKGINDKYGHLVGDKTLKAIAHLLKQTARGTDVVGRWGGEEFLIICVETTIVEATKLANRIITELNAQPLIHDIAVTASIGIANAHTGQLSSEAVLQAADENLYQAKKEGRNKAVS